MLRCVGSAMLRCARQPFGEERWAAKLKQTASTGSQTVQSAVDSKLDPPLGCTVGLVWAILPVQQLC